MTMLHWRVRSLRIAAVAAILGLSATLPPLSAAECRPVPPERIAANDFSKGLLWKIETPNGMASYLFGTFHSSDPRIVTLPCPVKAAFDRSTSYSMEVIMNGAGIVTMAQAMYLDGNKTLKEVVGEKLYRETRAALEKLA